MHFSYLKKSLVILGFLVTGCSSDLVKCDLVAYNAMAQPKGESVQVVPRTLEIGSSPNFLNYSSQIKEQLELIGYSIKDTAAPDLVFTINYGVLKEEKPKNDTAVCTLHYHYDENKENEDEPEFFGKDCDDHEDWNQSFYNHYLEVSIQYGGDLHIDEKAIFEANVFSRSYKEQMPVIMPYLIKTLFMDFPGENFAVKSVVLNKEKNDQ